MYCLEQNQLLCLRCVHWSMQKRQAQAKLAIADQDTPTIHNYDARGGSNEPLDSIQP